MGPESQPHPFSPRCNVVHPFIAATDPVGGADHTQSIRSDEGSSKPLESWEDEIHRHPPRKRPLRQHEEHEKTQDGDHQIDDYA